MNKIESTPKEQHIDDSGFKNSHLLSSIADNSKIIDKSQKENHYIKYNLFYLITELNLKNLNELLRNCEICGYIFPTDLNSTIYEEHLNSHYGPSCPVCFLTFRKGNFRQKIFLHLHIIYFGFSSKKVSHKMNTKSTSIIISLINCINY